MFLMLLLQVGKGDLRQASATFSRRGGALVRFRSSPESEMPPHPGTAIASGDEAYPGAMSFLPGDVAKAQSCGFAPPKINGQTSEHTMLQGGGAMAQAAQIADSDPPPSCA